MRASSIAARSKELGPPPASDCPLDTACAGIHDHRRVSQRAGFVRPAAPRALVLTEKGVMSPTFRPEALLLHVTERSILDEPNLDKYRPLAVGGRARHATCSGVAWFRGYHLAVVNLYGQHLRVYRFDPGDGAQEGVPRLELLHETKTEGSYPEDVAAAPNGRMLAIAHSMSKDIGVTLHAIDPISLMPNAGKVIRRGPHFHGLSFSPDSRHLAFT